MKTLLLLRHGKAQSDAPAGDKARHLTDRGRTEAAEAGRQMAHIGRRISSVISSDAERAMETAEIAASAAGYSGPIKTESDIYNADLHALTELVQRLPDEDTCVVLVGHNPGFSDLATSLVESSAAPVHMTTAALAHIEFDATRWRDVRRGTGRLVAVHLP